MNWYLVKNSCTLRHHYVPLHFWDYAFVTCHFVTTFLHFWLLQWGSYSIWYCRWTIYLVSPLIFSFTSFGHDLKLDNFKLSTKSLKCIFCGVIHVSKSVIIVFIFYLNFNYILSLLSYFFLDLPLLLHYIWCYNHYKTFVYLTYCFCSNCCFCSTSIDYLLTTETHSSKIPPTLSLVWILCLFLSLHMKPQINRIGARQCWMAFGYLFP